MSTSTLDPHSPAETDPVAAAETIARDLAEETCVNCHNTEPFGDSEWCPRCGYHPRFEMVFDVETGGWEQPANSISDVLPPWLITFAVGLLGIVVLGVVARLQFSVPQRAMWTLGQLLFGFVAFGTAHVAAYTHATSESDKFGPFDLFFQPFAIWKPTTRDLPENAWRVWLAGWGIVAAVVGLAVVGGIDWMGIFDADWGVKKTATGNLVHAVVDQARRERDGGAESLEDAMNDFAGEEEQEEPVKKRRAKADCLVVGCIADADGKAQELLLASVFNRKLRYVGRIEMVHLPPELREELQTVIPLLERDTPFVECKAVGASWLHPVKLMRLEIDGWTPSGRIKDPLFAELLEDVTLE